MGQGEFQIDFGERRTRIMRPAPKSHVSTAEALFDGWPTLSSEQASNANAGAARCAVHAHSWFVSRRTNKAVKDPNIKVGSVIPAVAD